MSPRRPNVILLTLDSLRADCVGGPPGQSLTPSLDRFAQSAAVFTNAFAQGPYTTMSMPSLFTGCYPSRLFPIEVREIYGVRPGTAPTMSEALAGAGYYTLGFHSNPFLSRVFGFDRGFVEFYDDLLFEGRPLPARWKLLLNRVHRLGRRSPYLPAAALNRKVRAGLERAQEPFFLWVHYMDVHGPYQSGQGWAPLEKVRAERLWRKAVRQPADVTAEERETLWECYREQVRALDEQLGVLLEGLGRTGGLERSLVVITADHGDEFGEHGTYTHSHKLYDELIHVPLLVAGPGVMPRPVNDLVELVQLFPTILDWLGVPLSGRRDGQSLRPVLAGTPCGLRGECLSEAEILPNYISGLRTHDWKFIREEESGREELYDLRHDPGEQRNLVESHPDVAAALRERLCRRRQGEIGSGRLEALTAEEERLVEARLRDLGYL